MGARLSSDWPVGPFWRCLNFPTQALFAESSYQKANEVTNHVPRQGCLFMVLWSKSKRHLNALPKSSAGPGSPSKKESRLTMAQCQSPASHEASKLTKLEMIRNLASCLRTGNRKPLKNSTGQFPRCLRSDASSEQVLQIEHIYFTKPATFSPWISSWGENSTDFRASWKRFVRLRMV